MAGSTASAPAGPSLERLLSINGGAERLRDANALAFDRAGNLYIGEYISGTSVKVFAPDGTFLRKWGRQGEGDGEFGGVTGIAIDALGKVYVADFSNTRIQIFDNAGKFLGKIATEPPIGPGGVAVDKDGNIYAANHRAHDHYVQKFSPDGTLLLSWGGNGQGGGEFAADERSGPGAVVIDGAGNVYVPDPNNSRIQKFDTSGKWLASIGSKGDGDDQFGAGNPSGVAVDKDGNLYTTDRGNIVKFDPSGRLLARWAGTAGSPSGTFAAVGVIRLDDQGSIYVLNKLDGTILKFRQR